MFRFALPTGALAALLAILLVAPAGAQAPVLVAQIAQATPTPTPLAEEPPGLDEEAPDDGDDSDGASGNGGAGRDDEADPNSLADTGIDAGLVALMGLGLIGTGAGLRRLTAAHDGLWL